MIGRIACLRVDCERTLMGGRLEIIAYLIVGFEDFEAGDQRGGYSVYVPF